MWVWRNRGAGANCAVPAERLQSDSRVQGRRGANWPARLLSRRLDVCCRVLVQGSCTVHGSNCSSGLSISARVTKAQHTLQLSTTNFNGPSVNKPDSAQRKLIYY